MDSIGEDGSAVAARLDVVTRIEGVTYYLDVSIVDPLTDDPVLLSRRAGRDGLAAVAMEDHKRRRYRPGVTPL
eukprot:5033774-Alexandrium_andersonii.AAC.1